MKLTDLLNEDVYVKNKKTGNVYQVKNANPAKHTTPSKGELEKAKADDGGSKEKPKDDSPTKSDTPQERIGALVSNVPSEFNGEDHARAIAKDIYSMDHSQMESAVQNLFDKNDMGGRGDEMQKLKYSIETKVRDLKWAEKKAFSDDEDKSMEGYDEMSELQEELQGLLTQLADDEDFVYLNNEEYGEREENESIRESKSMKLKDLLNEQNQSKSYQRLNIGEEEEEKRMTSEEKKAFLEAVSAYKKFGETIYRNGDLMETYTAIKGIVENANKVTLEETGDWFDRVTVNRHMKSMNESFKVFQKTLTEVHTLQQRLESTYDEIGEVLSKYYEIKEGNEFGAERAKAIAQGKDEFEVDGKKYPVKGVDKKDKENAKKFTNESKSMKLKDLIK